MSNNWFRSTVFRGGIEGISLDQNNDISDGTIKGVAVATEGLAAGHNVHLDIDFIEEVARLGNEKESGLKARFGHPAMSSDAVGTFAGRFNNFRVVEEIVRADLELAESSRKSPNGDLKEYILSLAKESPDMFGISIVFTPGKKYQRDDNGKKITDRDDFKSDRKTFVWITNLHAADVVDEPAANTGLFSQWSSEMIAGKVADFLDMNPALIDLVENRPEIVEPFFARYHKQKQGVIMKDKTEITEITDVNPVTAPERKTQVAVIEYSERDLFAEMKERFGLEFAAQAFDDGLSIEEATEKHIKMLSDRVLELSAKLEVALNAVNPDGAAPLNAEAISDLEDQLKAENEERVKKFSAIMADGVARFAAGIKLKNNRGK